LYGIAAKITISQPVHQVEAEVINIITRSAGGGLRNAIAMIARVGVVDTRRLTQVSWMRLSVSLIPRRTAPCTATLAKASRLTLVGCGPITNAASPAGGGVKLSRSDGRNPSCGCLNKFSGQPEVVGLEGLPAFCRVQNKNPSGEIGCARSIKDMTAHIITVRPDADLWIITKFVGSVTKS